LVRDDHELIDVLRRGQFVMTSILSLDGVQRVIDAAIVDLFPSEAPAAERRAASGS
jgi:hypothetical protein